MPHVGAQELIIGVLIVLLLFVLTKLPQLAKGLGEGLRESRAGTGLPRRPRPEPLTLADLLRLLAVAAVLSVALLWWARG
jgi:Sec-independent protein translocase protein TatA